MHTIINKKLIRIYIYGILSQIYREFAQGEFICIASDDVSSDIFNSQKDHEDEVFL
jgi:uncharacterized protein YegJ (DUF2314 family)